MILEFILKLIRDSKRMTTDDENGKYKQAFGNKLHAFRQFIQQCAEQENEDIIKQYEKENDKKRLGPHGLDPIEVVKSLAKMLLECFETHHIEQLHEVLSKMPREEAAHHLDRCIKSGLLI